MANNNFCPFCGAAISRSEAYETRFCPFCGKELPAAEPEEKSAAAPQPVPQPAQPAPAAEAHPPVQKQDPLFYPEQQAKPEKRSHAAGAAPSGKAGGIRIKTRGRWYVAIVAWALAWSALVYAAEEVFDFNPAVIIGLVICGSMPLWYPRFHPDAKTKKGVVLRWTIIMIAILIGCFLLVKELA